jgi:ARC6-like, IMS domain
MKLARYIGLVIVLIFSQSLESCQQEVTSKTLCSHQPEAILTSDRVKEVNLSSTATILSGHSSVLQPIGYKFTAKKGQVINYKIDNSKMCEWLYDPDNQIVKETTLAKDGIYMLQLAQSQGTGSSVITMTLTPDLLPPSPEPAQSPSKDTPTNVDPPQTQPQPQPSINEKNSPKSPIKVPFSNLTKRETRNLIGKWMKSKKSLFGQKYDRREAEEITTGEAYRYVRGESNNKLKDLSSKGEYFTYEKQQIHNIVKISKESKNRVRVMAIITEHSTQHYPKADKIKKFVSNQNFFCYEFTSVHNEWKISRTHQLIKDCKR